jgi:hypothetical protein
MCLNSLIVFLIRHENSIANCYAKETEEQRFFGVRHQKETPHPVVNVVLHLSLLPLIIPFSHLSSSSLATCLLEVMVFIVAGLAQYHETIVTFP